jgi:glucosylceramidase
LGPKFAERSVEADIWFGTMSAPEDTQHVDTTMSDPTAAQYIKGIGLQWNTMSSVGTFSSKYGVPIIQSEHKCGNYPWEMATFNPDRPPNDHAYAEESWGLIRDWIKAGVNAYSAWNMVLDTQGQNLDVQRPWPQNALLTIDRTSHALTATPAYYVFRHLSYFVDPGAVRLGTTGESDALAFKNPDGSIVTVIHNGGGSAKAVTLGVGDTTLQFEVPAHGWASVNTK